MSDEHDNVVQLPVGTKENPLGTSKSGKPLTGAAGRPMTEEHKAKLAAGRARAKAERQAKREQEKVERGIARLGRKAVEEHALEKLKPQAIKVLEEIITTRTGVLCPECGHEVSKPLATAQQLITTAKAVLEHTEGRPAQKHIVERVDVIEYRVADYETDAASA